MKPEKPPKGTDNHFLEVGLDLLAKRHQAFLALSDQRYFYWEDVKYRNDLPHESPEKTWAFLKASRLFRQKTLPFGGEDFYYVLTTHIQKDIHEFDLKLMEGIKSSVITAIDEQSFLENSLKEEAIASSQIEGGGCQDVSLWP